MKIQDYQDLHQPLQHVQIIDESLPMFNHFCHNYDSFMLRHISFLLIVMTTGYNLIWPSFLKNHSKEKSNFLKKTI